MCSEIDKHSTSRLHQQVSIQYNFHISTMPTNPSYDFLIFITAITREKEINFLKPVVSHKWGWPESPQQQCDYHQQVRVARITSTAMWLPPTSEGGQNHLNSNVTTTNKWGWPESPQQQCDYHQQVRVARITSTAMWLPPTSEGVQNHLNSNVTTTNNTVSTTSILKPNFMLCSTTSSSISFSASLSSTFKF